MGWKVVLQLEVSYRFLLIIYLFMELWEKFINIMKQIKSVGIGIYVYYNKKYLLQ